MDPCELRNFLSSIRYLKFLSNPAIQVIHIDFSIVYSSDLFPQNPYYLYLSIFLSKFNEIQKYTETKPRKFIISTKKKTTILNRIARKILWKYLTRRFRYMEHLLRPRIIWLSWTVSEERWSLKRVPRSTGWKVGFKAAWYCTRRIVMPRRNSCWMPGEMSVDAPTWFAASRLPVCSPATILKSCRASLVPTRAWLQTASTQYLTAGNRLSVKSFIYYTLYR